MKRRPTLAIGQLWRRKSSGQLAIITAVDSMRVSTEPVTDGRRSGVLIDAFTRQWSLVEEPQP